MKKQRIIIGSVLEININEDYFAYAQVLGKSSCAFFDFRSTERLQDLTVLRSSQILFIVSVYDNVIKEGRWVNIGNLEIDNRLKILPLEFIQDPINVDRFNIYNPNTGEIIKATREQCENLECAAVWEASHIEDRIRDHYLGVSNVWLEQTKIK